MADTKMPQLPEPIKSDHAALLNRLDEMQRSPYYATARATLLAAEMTIVRLEAEAKAAYAVGLAAAARICESQEGDALTLAVAKGCASAIRSLHLSTVSQSVVRNSRNTDGGTHGDGGGVPVAFQCDATTRCTVQCAACAAPAGVNGKGGNDAA